MAKPLAAPSTHRKEPISQWELLLVGLVTIGVFRLQQHFPVLYWAFPPIVSLAFHVDLAGVLVGLLLCFAIAPWFTMHCLSALWSYPFSSTQARSAALQLFMVAALCVALPISAAQVRRRRLIAPIEFGERCHEKQNWFRRRRRKPH
jgi:hypothetical protein